VQTHEEPGSPTCAFHLASVVLTRGGAQFRECIAEWSSMSADALYEARFAAAAVRRARRT
jgi:hypothetical protein